MKEPRVLAATVVALALLVIGISLNSTFRLIAKRDRTLSVTGSATRVIRSDLGKVSVSIEARGATTQQAYALNQQQSARVLAELRRQGVPDSAIAPLPPVVNPVYETSNYGVNTNNVIGYVSRSGYAITLRNVNLVNLLAQKLPELNQEGLRVEVTQPEYYYTKLGEVKVAIQADAARDARQRALQIAEASEADLGPMTSARMGVLQITPRYSVNVDDYGMNDVSSIEKEVRAVVSASFVLE
jgi:hypothetical protein